MVHRFVQLGLSVAIAVTFVALVAVGINVFVSHADISRAYSACGEPYAPALAPGENLTAEGREQQKEDARQARECQQRIDEERRGFEQKIFAIAVPIGALGVAAGALVFTKVLPLAAVGMTFGGLLTILYGMIRGIGAVDNRVIFVTVLFAFAGLLAVAWRKGKVLLKRVA